MTNYARGRRAEYRSAALLEALGYDVTRSAGSKGLFDLIAVSSCDVLLVQVKRGRPPSPAEREALADFRVPANCRKLVHLWRPRLRLPIVAEL